MAVDQITHEGLKEIMVRENSNVLQSLPPNSFQVSACIYIKFYNMNDVLHCMPSRDYGERKQQCPSISATQLISGECMYIHKILQYE